MSPFSGPVCCKYVKCRLHQRPPRKYRVLISHYYCFPVLRPIFSHTVMPSYTDKGERPIFITIKSNEMLTDLRCAKYPLKERLRGLILSLSKDFTGWCYVIPSSYPAKISKPRLKGSTPGTQPLYL